jgi:hypothetical protein
MQSWDTRRLPSTAQTEKMYYLACRGQTNNCCRTHQPAHKEIERQH